MPIPALLVLEFAVKSASESKPEADGVRQYVIPGAGLDSFANRRTDVVDRLHVIDATLDTVASLLSDNAAVFTGRTRRGKVLLELELERLGIVFKHSTPYHPQTCGKVERFHQTLKRFLRKQPPARSIAELQFQLDAFRDYYNN